MMHNFFHTMARRLALAGLALGLAACGGGGGSAGTTVGTGSGGTSGGGTAGKSTIVLELLDSTGAAKNALAAGKPLTARATVKDGSGKPVANTIVTFTTGSPDLGVLSPVSGKSLTDANGQATATLTLKSADLGQTQAGAADSLSATATLTDGAVTASANFTISKTSIPSITLDLLDSKGAAKNSVTTGAPLTARATVMDANGKPMANTIVVFGTQSIDYVILSPASGRALTDATGQATVTMSLKSLDVAQTQAGAADVLSAAMNIDSKAYTASANYTVGTTNLSLQLLAPAGGSTSIKAYDTAPIKVQVLADGVLFTALPVTINFTSACASNGKASLPATAITVNGVAQVVYGDKGCAATDTVSISAAGVKPALAATVVVAPPVAASIGFVSATPSDKAIVIKGAGGNGRVETALLTFQALDTFGQPLPNQTVTFSVNSTATVSLQSTTALTGADGKVIVAVNSGASPTTFRVIATLPSGQSSISDTVTVTTGQPVQAAFSLALKESNIEGFNYDNQFTTLTTLIADVNGNPVADGTPVVSQTDSGAIGSASVGGCQTTNGGCDVTFRSQAPRFTEPNSVGKRAGVATVTVSSTSATATLTDKIGVFLSGSAAQMYMGGSPVASGNNTIALGSCSAGSFDVEVFDQNLNPLPIRTKIEGSNADKVGVTNILPGAVPNVGVPRSFFADVYTPTAPLTRVSTVHTVIVKPDAASCSDTGVAGKGKGTFGLTVTTPLGSQRLFFFQVTYPAP